MKQLTVVASAQSTSVSTALKSQLGQLDFIHCIEVVNELSDVFKLVKSARPDVLIVDITDREYDAGLFMEALSTAHDCPAAIFALHQRLEHKIILEAVRQGAKEFVHYPDDAQALEAALQRQLSRLQRQKAITPGSSTQLQPSPDKKTIAVFSGKGGAGTSTVAVNLAYELSVLTNESVLLLDMDQVFSNIAIMLNIRPTYSLRDLTSNNAQDVDHSLLKGVVVEHDSGLNILVGSKNIMDDTEMIPLPLLERIMKLIKERYTYVVIDLPTHILDSYHQFFIDQADDVLLVSCLDIPGLYRTRQYLDLARQHVDVNKIKLLLNRWNLRAAYGMSNKNLEEEFRFPVYFRLPNDWDLNVEAHSLGNVFSRLNLNADLSKSFQKLAALITMRDVAALGNTNKATHKGLLSRIFEKK